MTKAELELLQEKAEATLRELMNLLNQTPHLAAEISTLMQSPDILAVFQGLMKDKPEVSEQLLRMSLATTVNYHSTVEIGQQLATDGNCPKHIQARDSAG